MKDSYKILQMQYKHINNDYTCSKYVLSIYIMSSTPADGRTKICYGKFTVLTLIFRGILYIELVKTYL